MNVPTLALLLVSLIWGTTFVAVKTAVRDGSPLLFVGLRFLLGALCALPLLRADRGSDARNTRNTILAGIPLGIILAGAYASQTIGLTTTSPARSAFLTGLNVALVPFWALAWTGRRPAGWQVGGLVLTIPGLWLLTSPGAGSWNRGDSWTLVCAVLYALYVVRIGTLGRRHPTGLLLVSQLATTAAVALLASPLLERPRLALTPSFCGALAMTALLATAGTTWLQLRMQPRVGSTRAAVVYATEPVFAAGFSWLLLGEGLSARAWIGGAFILAGMLVSEIGGRQAVPERG